MPEVKFAGIPPKSALYSGILPRVMQRQWCGTIGGTTTSWRPRQRSSAESPPPLRSGRVEVPPPPSPQSVQELLEDLRRPALRDPKQVVVPRFVEGDPRHGPSGGGGESVRHVRRDDLV